MSLHDNWAVATQIFFIFIPDVGEDSHFDAHIFQMGWFHHQLDNLRIKLDRGAHLIAMLAYFLLRGGGANHKVAVVSSLPCVNFGELRTEGCHGKEGSYMGSMISKWLTADPNF